MKKAEKKENKKNTEKKKSGKKKMAKQEDSFESASKAFQQEFNKKMKALVKEVKKDTQNTIKTVMIEAREKIQAGSEFIMNDVLKAVVTQYEGLTGDNDQQKEQLTEGDSQPAKSNGKATPKADAPEAAKPTTKTAPAPKTNGTATKARKAPANSRTQKPAPVESSLIEAVETSAV